jgi:hypothetical protein
VPDAPVTISVERTGKPDAPAPHALSGQVPLKAITAVLALRINAECGCSGSADVGIGPARYLRA